MTPLEMSVAEVSSFSFCAVLLGFCAIYLYITRNMINARGQQAEFVFPTSVQRGSPRVPQMNMMRIQIPFTFKLLQVEHASYAELQFSVSSEVSYQVHSFWGMSIKHLHVFLWRPWYDIRDAIARGDFLKGHYERSALHLTKDANIEEKFTLSLDEASSKALELGTPPRTYYPLVVIVLRNDLNKNVHLDDTVALVTVIHIKDSVCTLPTGILAQYIKQVNGQLSSLKQLYLSTESQSYDEQLPVPVTESVDSEQQYCIVCQYFPLSRAILPCRHTCVCASCFVRLDRCPMCRGAIQSYFCIRDEKYMNDCSSLKQNQPRWSLMDWLHSWDDRLTDFLGFQR